MWVFFAVLFFCGLYIYIVLLARGCASRGQLLSSVPQWLSFIIIITTPWVHPVRPCNAQKKSFCCCLKQKKVTWTKPHCRPYRVGSYRKWVAPCRPRRGPPSPAPNSSRRTWKKTESRPPRISNSYFSVLINFIHNNDVVHHHIQMKVVHQSP